MRPFLKPVDKTGKAADTEYNVSNIAASDGRHAMRNYHVAGNRYRLGRRHAALSSTGAPSLSRSKRREGESKYK